MLISGAGVKIIGEDYITTYQPGEQLIYQTNSGTEEQHQDCSIQEQHNEQQNECIQQDNKSQVVTGTTIIPIPNMSNIFSSNNPSEVRTKNNGFEKFKLQFSKFFEFYRRATCISSLDCYRTLRI